MIDRSAVLRRHSPHVTHVLPESPLAVGNGEFCFTADVTGLQTFPDAYPLPDRYGQGRGTLLATMAQWGWHTTPPAAGEDGGIDSTMRTYATPHGPARYVDLGGDLGATTESGLTPTERWLRGNPHRLDLARIGLRLGEPGLLRVEQLSAVDQRLDLETGILLSRFRLAGRGFTVRTAVHPERDVLTVEIIAAAGGPFGISLAFPYGSTAWGDAADWSRPQAHHTELTRDASGWLIARTLDADGYTIHLSGTDLDVRQSGTQLVDVLSSGPRFVCDLRFTGTAGSGSRYRPPPSVDGSPAYGTFAASARGWSSFWNSGAAVDLSDSDHGDDARELERRVVLSQYLTRIHGSGSLPPAETGLTANSWRGKFHLEMHWWHAAHFASWGRPSLLERSLAWYERILPAARETARRQGLPGVRWPKQAGPAGEETPSPVGPFLLWQQPHPIHLAELVRRARPGDPAVLRRWAPVVLGTAEFMAALPERTEAGYELAPPLVPAQESYDRRTARNPAFELAYWSWALRVADEWSRRLGLGARARWREVSRRMVPAHVRNGLCAAISVPPYTVRDDHPSMLGALGLVPPTHVADPATMERTLLDVLAGWNWDSAWGWDFPLAAMTATRLGRPGLATRALLLPVRKNHYLTNGNNWQDETLPVYLPGNGGLLSAVALMARGWAGSGDCPGFGPGWRVRHEGFVAAP